MATSNITFNYLTGINKNLFSNVRIRGSWDANGQYNSTWLESPMQRVTGEDGCPAFTAIISLDNSIPGQVFNWGVVLDGPGGTNLWGINTEINDPDNTDRYCSFTVNPNTAAQTENFYLTYKRRLGATPYLTGKGKAALRFSAWAPHAIKVEVIFGTKGYIYDDGTGIDPKMPVVPLTKDDMGIWTSSPLSSFKKHEGRHYMFRVTNAQGQITYRTDIFSRELAGMGATDPSASHWDGTLASLDGTVSCGIIVDPDTISSEFPVPAGQPPKWEHADTFWQNEFNPDKPIPTSIDDMVIYELHVGALGNTPNIAGTLTDAVALLDYLAELGINAIELLPILQFFGDESWGYGDTHHMVIQGSEGGRDEYRYFVRECHRRGIAVIQDVVYNHYDDSADRAEWAYDSNLPEQNSYYYYVGKSTDYPDPNGGYLNNGSSGWSPNFGEPMVRQQFISSAAFLIDEMHVDGFRADLTQAIHRDNTLNSPPYNGVGVANQFGAKFLREWGQTIRLIHPGAMLMAEDYTGYDMVTAPVSVGGFGFNATWFADFFHGLVGYQGGPQLLVDAGTGDDSPLDMDDFSTLLYNSQFNKVVYHINHDNAGANNTHRTVVTAANAAPLVGSTLVYAEMRARVVFALSLLSAGTPLFFMGEEIAAQKPYTYDQFLNNREDLQRDKETTGASMYRYYQDILTLNKTYPSIRSKNIDILTADNNSRVIIFKRWEGTEQVLIAASLNNSTFERYTLNTDTYRLPDGGWKEIFNSDASVYGGTNTGNGNADIPAVNGSITMVIPANGVVVFVMG